MMSRKVTVLMIIIAAGLCHGLAFGEEGMWPHYDVGKISFEKFRPHGLELQPKDIFDPDGGGLYRAVVRLGATGSFVSEKGLIITNHHVAFGAVQKQSTASENLVKDGFYAPTRQEEIPAIGYNAWVTLSVEDVTDRVLTGITDDMDDYDRYQAMDRAIKEIIDGAEKKGDYKCRVARMFGGKQFILYTQLKIRDIRIVYVPPSSIGVYGGDIDNWMWPRHTGDFSFLRAYVAPDGSSAEYAEENVPYHPDVYLPIAKAGVDEGDFAMIIGFPGGTSRYASSFYIDDLIGYSYPRWIRLSQDVLGIIEKVSAEDEEVAIRLSSRVQGLNNSLKNSLGMMDGFDDWGLLEKKLQAEAGLSEFIAGSPGLVERYGGVLSGLDSLYRQKKLTRDRDYALRMLGWPNYAGMAFAIYKWALERGKEDLDRERGYQDRDSSSTREWLEDVQVNLVPGYDRALLEYLLARALELPEGQRIASVDETIGAAGGGDRRERLNTWLDDAFGRTGIGDLDKRMKMFTMSLEELEALKDPFIEFAKNTYAEREEIKKRAKKFSGMSSRLEPKLISAYAEWKNYELYPDANGTMRVNFGVVKGYSPRDALNYTCFTTVAGVLEKETGEDPFIVPPELKQYHRSGAASAYIDPGLGDVPVNLLTTNDATGGNSGSPVIDGRGRLVGLLFDCNYESIAADYLFNPDVTRSISVDIRYVLHVIDEIYHLDALVDELTVL
ncbi:MAG: S46 family peptidase [Candidatus Zixiibacteriota bacterium]|nr:MAG: S46 family peptidase [candidate division Zixibacteria bacterium]